MSDPADRQTDICVCVCVSGCVEREDAATSGCHDEEFDDNFEPGLFLCRDYVCYEFSFDQYGVKQRLMSLPSKQTDYDLTSAERHTDRQTERLLAVYLSDCFCCLSGGVQWSDNMARLAHDVLYDIGRKWALHAGNLHTWMDGRSLPVSVCVCVCVCAE